MTDLLEFTRPDSTAPTSAPRPMRVAAAVLLGLTLAVSGCSGDDEDAASARSTTTIEETDESEAADETDAAADETADDTADNTAEDDTSEDTVGDLDLAAPPIENGDPRKAFADLVCNIPMEMPDETNVRESVATTIAVLRAGIGTLDGVNGIDTSTWGTIADDFEAHTAALSPEELLDLDPSDEAVAKFGAAFQEATGTLDDVGCPE